ncbi:MAG: OmpH family outer membrane protein [Petrimonas sp.]|nr:OmpH family outer membrane protein [Petrimonas sp.]
MKNSTSYIIGGVLAVALIVLYILFFTSRHSSSNGQQAGVSLSDSTVNLPVAYVDVDSLLTNYNFSKDLNEALMRKEESSRATLNQKQNQLNAAAQEFQRKLQNNAFLSQERAEQEQQRILKMQQEYQQMAERISMEFQQEQLKLNAQLYDTIKVRLEEYNAIKNYEIIYSNTRGDNLLYAKKKYDITPDVIEFLNKKYGPATASANEEKK